MFHAKLEDQHNVVTVDGNCQPIEIFGGPPLIEPPWCRESEDPLEGIQGRETRERTLQEITPAFQLPAVAEVTRTGWTLPDDGDRLANAAGVSERDCRPASGSHTARPTPQGFQLLAGGQRSATTGHCLAVPLTWSGLSETGFPALCFQAGHESEWTRLLRCPSTPSNSSVMSSINSREELNRFRDRLLDLSNPRLSQPRIGDPVLPTGCPA